MLDFSSNPKKKWPIALSILCLTALTFSFSTSASAQCAMACEDQVYVGLDPSICEATITYDMIIKGQNDPLNCSPNAPSDFSVILTETLGGPAIPGSPVITREDFGKKFYATVTHIPSNIYCTGSITIDDHSAPVIECPADTVVDCGASTDTASTGAVMFNTCLDATVTVSDYKENMVMTCTGIAERITRTFRVTGANGKTSSCTQVIDIERPTFSDLSFPPDRNGTEAPKISCDSISLGIEVTGQPNFNGMPVDLKYGLCGFSTSYRDRTIDDCGNTFTIVRTWTVVDPCSSTVMRDDQIIIVADKKGPEISCPDTLTVSTTDLYSCTATTIMPTVDITDNCSSNIAVSMQTPNGSVSSNGGQVNNLPEGYNEIIYYATDECGMVGSCKTIVEVVDKTAPSLTCEDRITVSLTDSGAAVFGTASTVLESEDNCCTNVSLDIRRMDAGNDDAYSEEVIVTCDDVGQQILVLSRSTDCNGNENICMVRVDVVDNSSSTTIECPADTTVNCSVDYNDPMETGLPIVTGVCSASSTLATYTDDTDLTICGTGTIQRTWSLSIETEGNSSCVQQITVIDPTPIQVTFPLDLTLNQCLSLNDLDPSDLEAPYDRPTISGDDDCNNVNISYQDQPIFSEPGSCVVLERVWTVTETCVYDPLNPGAGGIYQHTQRIVINETTPPVLTCQQTLIVSTGADCVENVFISGIEVSGECFPEDVTLAVSGDLGGGRFFLNVPVGEYDMTAVATDRCGNSSSCDITVRVLDEVSPTADCLPQFTANIDVDGTVTVLGSDLNDASSDNCTSSNDLEFRIGPSPPASTTTPPANLPLIFTCDDLGSLANVAMWVGDETGNWSFCSTNIQISDPQGNCTAGAPAATVAGVVQSPAGEMIDQVELSVFQNNTIAPIVTNQNGSFSFNALPVSNNYRIIAERNTAYNESVSTSDLVKLMKHLTGQRKIEEPYAQIAADVNGDTRISIFDAILMQKLILNLQTEVANSPSWRFLPSSFDFVNSDNVFDNGFPEFMDIRNLQSDYMNADFTGVKIGDINMSYRANNALSADLRSTAAAVVVTNNKNLTSDGLTSISFTLPKGSNLGFQLGLQISPDLEIVDVKSSTFGDGLLYHQPRPGYLMVSAVQWQTVPVESSPLFELIVRSKVEGSLEEMIRLAPEMMIPEVILEGKEAPLSIELAFAEAATEFDAWVSPNPISDIAYLNLKQAVNETIRYQLWTADGRLLLSAKINTETGLTQVPIRREQLPQPGVYFLQVIGKTGTKTLRLLRQ